MANKTLLKCLRLLVVIFNVTLFIIASLCISFTVVRKSFKIERTTPPPFYIKGAIAPHNFTFINNNENICSSAKNLTYFIYVFTRAGGFEERKAIRETWGRRDLFRNTVGRVAFMLGATTDKDVQDKIDTESRVFNDIVQENFIDSYGNLSFKGIMASKWIAHNCQNAKFVLKVDDDIMLNIFKMVEFLEKHVKTNARTMYCHVLDAKLREFFLVRNESVHRRQLPDLFVVSQEQFDGDRYPEYCHGMVWVGTPDLFVDLYKASFNVPYVQIEDAFTTGILRNYTGTIFLEEVVEFYETRIKRTHMYDFYNNESNVPIAVWTDNNHARETAWQLMLCRLNYYQKEITWDYTYSKIRPPSCDFRIPISYYIIHYMYLVWPYAPAIFIITLLVVICCLVRRNRSLQKRLFNLMKYVVDKP